MCNRGKFCIGVEFQRNDEGETYAIYHDTIVDKLLKKSKAQTDLEIQTKMLGPNDLRVEKRMFHREFTKCVKPKAHLQPIFTREEIEVFC